MILGFIIGYLWIDKKENMSSNLFRPKLKEKNKNKVIIISPAKLKKLKQLRKELTDIL
jgi:hypothetical protein